MSKLCVRLVNSLGLRSKYFGLFSKVSVTFYNYASLLNVTSDRGLKGLEKQEANIAKRLSTPSKYFLPVRLSDKA